MTVLSPSTVAMPMCSPAHIEIWDWMEGKCVRTLTGFRGYYALANTLLPDGRFLASDWARTIRVGSLDAWTAATTTPNRDNFICALAFQDGSFVTTDEGGNLKLWKDGICEVTLTGCCPWYYYGLQLAVIGRRLIVAGNNDNLLVAE